MFCCYLAAQIIRSWGKKDMVSLLHKVKCNLEISNKSPSTVVFSFTAEIQEPSNLRAQQSLPRGDVQV